MSAFYSSLASSGKSLFLIHNVCVCLSCVTASGSFALHVCIVRSSCSTLSPLLQWKAMLRTCVLVKSASRFSRQIMGTADVVLL